MKHKTEKAKGYLLFLLLSDLYTFKEIKNALKIVANNATKKEISIFFYFMWRTNTASKVLLFN